MSRGDGVEGARTGLSERGLWKLMLKLPAVRGRLQIVVRLHPSITNLFEAYEEASSALDQMRKNGSTKPEIIAEYETICAEIESEVIQMCLESR
ncbi:hypothetical protein G6K91_21970 [Agrobacterium rhizogenes]|nr:hypothetical protein [Rhizobium rhizogenes]NTG56145.1 hypothetical protein [Rhizobium rhizogenes]NTH01817.1 hypothetical protein [Rhizobium rhizogenes]NTI57528.1 hypothetical protein [Rhizobium rhizogenes]